jgi:hypothetical protein
MREAAILIILYTENINNSQYQVHFHSVNTGENQRGKICD